MTRTIPLPSFHLAFLTGLLICASAGNTLAADVTFDANVSIRNMPIERAGSPVCINSTTKQLVAGCDDATAPDLTADLCRLYTLEGYPSPAYCPARIVFATSKTFNGKLEGVDGADKECQAAAEKASLPGKYLAWIATKSGDDPATHFNRSASGYKLVDGELIAKDWSDLTDGKLHHSIYLDENGQKILDAPSETWTNVAEDGTAGSDLDLLSCYSWTSNDSRHAGSHGDLTQLDPNWTDTGNAKYCDGSLRLYCFQQ